MLRAFLLAQRHRLSVSGETVIAIRRRVAELGEIVRTDPETIQTFRSLLQGRRGVAQVLRDMHNAGILGELLPEFGDLTGLVRIDGYHRYTVDEHSLRTVEALESFEEEDGFLRDELLRVLRPDLLRLAALLHDIGKAAGPDHEAAGANRVIDVARRLGFGDEGTRILHDLLARHTELAELADQRVPEEVEQGLVESIGGAGRLRMLMLLNVADVRAVGRGALTGWRLDQIRRLYERVRDRLEVLPSREGAGASFEERLVAAAGRERAEAARVHAGMVPPRYRLEIDPETAALHLRLLEYLEEHPVAAMLLPARASGELWIASRDQPARFAQLAGALTATGLDVRSAEAYTRRDGIVLDVFHVADQEGRTVTDPTIAERLERDLPGAWSDPTRLEAAVRARRSRFRPGPEGPTVPVKVRISNKVSTRFTVVDVVARDRPGLLYDLARAIAAHELDIRFARIATRGDRIVDVFYLTGAGERVEDEVRLEALRRDLISVAEG
jgi:[protein-PII] uridylyltransferase